LDGSSVEVYESHFLPLEETDPTELGMLTQRCFLQVQAAELDHVAPRLWA
jgi:hypothetical protein